MRILATVAMTALCAVASATEWTPSFFLSNATMGAKKITFTASATASVAATLAKNDGVMMLLPSEFSSANPTAGDISCKLSFETRSFDLSDNFYIPSSSSIQDEWTTVSSELPVAEAEAAAASKAGVAFLATADAAAPIFAGVTVTSSVDIAANAVLNLICRLNAPAAQPGVATIDYVAGGASQPFNSLFAGSAATPTFSSELATYAGATYSVVLNTDKRTSFALRLAATVFFAVHSMDGIPCFAAAIISSATYVEAGEHVHAAAAAGVEVKHHDGDEDGALTLVMLTRPSMDKTQASTMSMMSSTSFQADFASYIPTAYEVASNSTVIAAVTIPGTCYDGIKNGLETDVDCGGGECAACDVNKICSADGDCWTATCADSKFCVNAAPSGPAAVVSMTVAAIAAVAVLVFAF